jgi:aryl-alcohol dehydrogenase-like predicted oxidoreductase/predicted kinase
MSWLGPSELRVGLGCMRLPEELVTETVSAAVDAGITVFDTARAYGENERLVARALEIAGATGTARIVTKGGMSRVDSRWLPDGRAKAIRADCEVSLEELGGLPIDLFLVHAPDPQTPWKTSVRTLGKLVDEGLVRRVGVANVNRRQLDEALELAPISAVQVALSVVDDTAIRGGIVERCVERGLTLIAHSPLGGPRRSTSLVRQGLGEAALAWLLELSPVVVAIPGARRPETARSAARAATHELTDGEREALGKTRPARARRRHSTGADVVLVMGIPGAGKSRVAEEYAAKGYVRLNRDERGGTLRKLAAALDEQLATGAQKVVLDNTYLTRPSRNYVVEAGTRHGAKARCIWLDTPLAQAQVNVVLRLLQLFGRLPAPEELKLHAREPGVLTPTSQMRAFRELEPPTEDEGFASLERIAFSRTSSAGRAGVFVATTADYEPEQTSAPHLFFDWRPGEDAAGPADSSSSSAASTTSTRRGRR